MTLQSSKDEVRRSLERAMKGTIGIRSPKPDVLDGAVAAAESTAALFETAKEADERRALLLEVGEGLPGDLRAWLFELPSFLAKKKRPEQGHALCDRFAPLLGEAYVESERSLVHWEAGNREQAKSTMDSLVERFPEHPWVHLRLGTISERSLDARRAETAYERALELAQSEGADRSDLRFSYDALISFHQTHGQPHRAIELSRQMLEAMPEVEEEFRVETIVNTAPKVGRNDPCPCGSGKKSKKCCAAVA